MQHFDHFEIRINRSFFVWTQDKGLLAAEIYINQQPLIELVYKVEEPLIQAEIKKRRATGEDINELDSSLGNYSYLPLPMVLLHHAIYLMNLGITDLGYSRANRKMARQLF